jgi:hypothetical protein
MIESNKTKRIGTNTFYAWTQEELPNKFYSINQQDTEIFEDLDDAGKTSEMEQAMMAHLGADDDNIFNVITIKINVCMCVSVVNAPVWLTLCRQTTKTGGI